MTWLTTSKYEHIPIEAATGPGTMYEGTAWKFVMHSTEGPPGSINGTVALFKAKPASCPHFTIDPMGTGRRVQHIRLNYSACALKGGRNGWQTNRARSIQMEICGYAKDSAGWPDDALWTIADVIADCILAGYPINPDNTPDSSTLRGTLATEYAPQRFNGPAWHEFDGIAAHVYAPFNDHWDCGPIRARIVAEYVRQILAGSGRTIVPRAPTGPLPNAPATTRDGYISKGMTGGTVAFVQQLLSGLNYNVGPGGSDGVFGYGTEQAVIQFQRDNRLVADGIVGPATSAALSAAYTALHPKRPALTAPAPAASGAPAWPGRYFVYTNPAMTGGDIATWQKQMVTRGWRIEADGVYGEQSRSTCKTYQAEKGLTVDGIVGPQTWASAWTAPVT